MLLAAIVYSQVGKCELALVEWLEVVLVTNSPFTTNKVDFYIDFCLYLKIIFK